MEDFVPPPLSSFVRVTHKFDGMIATLESDDFNTMHWNVNRLTSKLHQVELCIASFPGTLHLIAISETWLTTENSLAYQIAGYHAIHNVREDFNGGGVSIFVHNTICGNDPKILVDKISTELHHFLVIEIPQVKFTVTKYRFSLI